METAIFDPVKSVAKAKIKSIVTLLHDLWRIRGVFLQCLKFKTFLD